MAEKLIIFGASNAAGWAFNTLGVDYHTENIVNAALVRPSFVTELEDGITIDLSSDPNLDEIDKDPSVVNAAFPGDTVFELLARFEEEVLEENPRHLFIWPGLNDITVAVGLAHNRLDKEALDEYPEASQEFLRTYDRAQDVDGRINIAAEIIADNTGAMVEKAKTEGIQVILGTIPPYSARLAAFENDPEEPLAKHYITEGLAIISQVNQRLRNHSSEVSIVDAYELVADKNTGLMREDFSYGSTVPRFGGDILHLNSMGQLPIASSVCQIVMAKRVNVIPPNPSRFRNG